MCALNNILQRASFIYKSLNAFVNSSVWSYPFWDFFSELRGGEIWGFSSRICCSLLCASNDSCGFRPSIHPAVCTFDKSPLHQRADLWRQTIILGGTHKWNKGCTSWLEETFQARKTSTSFSLRLAAGLWQQRNIQSVMIETILQFYLFTDVGGVSFLKRISPGWLFCICFPHQQ